MSVDGHVLFDDVIVLGRLRDFLKSSILSQTQNSKTNKITIEIEPINRDFSIKNKYIYMSMLNKFSKKTSLLSSSFVVQSNTSSDIKPNEENEENHVQDDERDDTVLENENNSSEKNDLLVDEENSSSSTNTLTKQNSSSSILNNPLSKYIESHSLVILESLLLLDNITSNKSSGNNSNNENSSTTPIPAQVGATTTTATTTTPKNEFHRDSLLMFCLNFGTSSSSSVNAGGVHSDGGVSNSAFKFKFSNFLMRIKLVFTELDVLKEDIKKSLDEFLNEHVLNRLLSVSAAAAQSSNPENDETNDTESKNTNQEEEAEAEDRLQIEEETTTESLSDYVFEANIDRVCYLKKPSNCKTIRLEQIRSSTDCFRAMVEFSRRSELNERPLIFVTCHANVTLNRKVGK